MADDLVITIGANVRGVVTAIDKTKSLESRVGKLQKAVEQGRISNSQFDASLQKLAKASKGYERAVLDYSKALQDAKKAQAIATAADQLAKKEAQAFAQARKEATAINAQFNAQRKQEAAEATRAAAEEERLRRKFIEGHAAMELYSRELNDLSVARRANIITADEHRASLDKLNQDMASGTGAFSAYGANAQAAAKSNNQLGVATQQLGYQVGDFFVQIQSGTNPMVAFGQQATQLVGVLPLVAAQLGLTAAAAQTLSTVLGIAIPIFTAVGAVLLTMYMNSEDVNKSSEDAVDVFQRLRDATRELYIERMRLTDPTFDENLQGTGDKLQELTTAYQEAAKYADSFSQATLAAPTAESQMLLNFMSSYAQAAREAADAAVDKAKAELDAYQQEVGLAKAREMNNARIDAQNEQGLRDLNAKRALGISILSTIVEESKKRAEIAKSIGEAHLSALGIETANMEGGINRAAEAARVLANNLGISLSAATSMVNLAASEKLNQLKFEFSAGGQALQKYGSRGAGVGAGMPIIGSDGNPLAIPSIGGNGGGGGGGSAPSDPLADLMKRIELEKELLGTSEEYQEVMQAIKDSDKKYSDAAIQGAVARLEAINKEKEALQQMESLQQSIAETIGDGFMSMVDGTKTVKEAFRDMARDIIKQLYEVLVIQRLVNGVKGILGGSGLFADGGAFSAGRQIQAYANGGVVGGPTYFPMSGGKTGLMGEAGPEAIMPLKRGKGGKLGVSVEGGSGSVNVVNNINVTGGSDPAAIRAEVAKLMPQITSATKSAVIDARRRGGQMKSAFQ
jgi:phage-related minor tail protein